MFVILFVAAIVIGLFAVLILTAADTTGELAIGDVDPVDKTINENGTVQLSATIQNIGDTAETQVVEIWFGDEQYREEVTVEPGDTVTITMAERSANSLGLGDTEYTVSTEDDEVEGTISVVSDRPPMFEVSGLQPGAIDQVTEDHLNLSANVTNTGGIAGNQTVELRFDDEVIVDTRMHLEPGEMESFRVVNLGIGSLDPGEQTYGVYTANDSAEAQVDIPEPASIAVRDLHPGDVSLSRNDRFAVSATVENSGERTTTKTAELLIDDTPLAEEELELRPQEVRRVEFQEINTETLGIGTTNYLLQVGSQSASGSVVVEGDQPAQFEITRFEPGNTIVSGDRTLNLTATIENTGEQYGTETVALQINYRTRVSLSLELGPGETEQIRLYNIDVSDFEPGVYEYGISTSSDLKLARLVVE